ncbi:MAG: PAS domain S-box protein [Anaerolineae bacterium]
MEDQDKTKEQFMNELAELRQRVAELEAGDTECEQAEEALRESEQRYRQLFEGIGDAVMVYSSQGRFLDCNEATLKRLGYSHKKLLRLGAADIVHPDLHQLMKDNQERIWAGETTVVESGYRCKDGRVIPVEVNAHRIEYQGEPAILAVVRDITERKRAEEELRESEARYRELADSIADVFFAFDKDLRYTYWNKASEKLTGIPAKDAIGKSLYELFPDTPETRRAERAYLDVLRTQQPQSLVNPYHIGGRDFFFEISAYPSERGLSVFVKDITERKRAGEALRETRDYLDSLIRYANAPIIVWDPEGRITRFNHAFEHLTGYTADEVIGQELHMLFPEASRGESLNKIARTLAGEYWESVKIPILSKDGDIRVVLWNSANIYAEDGTTLLTTIAQGTDITKRKWVEEELQQSFEKLQRTFEGTVNVLVSVIEMRDPYTAGHQRRVTQLVCAVANEMGLPKEQIEGIHMAGLIHDIGKINVPAEILSKPGRLTELEFGLIKMHPQVGHDVLNGVIEFPWPVAQMVLQHHERMDGSGYPQGLSGEETILEARILGVADVVEAMASHRPYRSALGIDKALEEISQNKGVLYDPEVVDVCLKLFTEKGFEFE